MTPPPVTGTATGASQDVVAKTPSSQGPRGNDSVPIEVSVVLPCLNEEETLATCIAKAKEALKDVRAEIVVADNGSTDASVRIAKELGARVVAVAEKGYGNALMGGIRAASGEYVIMGDADDSYDFSAVMPFVDKLREGFDLVMGNRFLGGIAPRAMPALHRYLGNPVLTWIGRILFKSPSGDFHCGMRAFRRDALLGLDLRTTGMEFASEMVVKATLHRLRIAEVPTTLSPDGRSHPPHLRTWRDGWRHLRFLLLYSPRWLFLYPGLILIAIGLLGGAWLHQGPRTVGGVTLDVHTLLYASAAVAIGVQAVLFAVLAKAFAVSEGLLPEDPRLRRLLRAAPLEIGLVAGAVLFVAGLGGSVLAVGDWGARSFGDLDPATGLRTVIPSVLAMVVGCQIILSSCLLSVMRMGRR